jgi:hypothetical protein
VHTMVVNKYCTMRDYSRIFLWLVEVQDIKYRIFLFRERRTGFRPKCLRKIISSVDVFDQSCRCDRSCLLISVQCADELPASLQKERNTEHTPTHYTRAVVVCSECNNKVTMMFSRTSSALRQGIQRSAPIAQKQTVRKMGGGA